jgi:hypothetical protein
MGYIPSADTVYAVAYLTEKGRDYLFNETNNRFDNAGDDLFEITKFTLSDVDTNYQTIQLLSTGEVPDVTGKNEGCLKTTANYVQTNLLAFVFDDTPTDVSYATDLDNDLLIIDEDDIPSTTETPPAFPLILQGSNFTFNGAPNTNQ